MQIARKVFEKFEGGQLNFKKVDGSHFVGEIAKIIVDKMKVTIEFAWLARAHRDRTAQSKAWSYSDGPLVVYVNLKDPDEFESGNICGNNLYFKRLLDKNEKTKTEETYSFTQKGALGNVDPVFITGALVPKV